MGETMRIAIFHATLPQDNRKSGGVSVVVDRLAEVLARDNDVTVFSLDKPPLERKYTSKLVFGGNAFLRDNPIARVILLPLLLNFIRFRDYDVVNFHGDDWFYVSKFPRRVRTMHGSALSESKSATNIKRKILQRVVYFLEKLSVINSDVTVAVGPDAKKIYRLNQRIDNGVDFGLFFPRQKSTKPVIMFIGTWEGRKRGKFLYEVFVNVILKQFPDAILKMCVDHYEEHQSVEFYANPSDVVLANLYAEAWVFAYPSTYEGFGLPYIESLASGTAIVTSKNPGSLYILENGRFGSIVANDSDFAKEIIELLENPNRRCEMEKKGMLRAKDFDWIQIANSYTEVFKLLSKK